MAQDPASDSANDVLYMPTKRSSCPYKQLPSYSADLKKSNTKDCPVELERHHIIPCNELITFWNIVRKKGLTRNLRLLLQKMQQASKKVYEKSDAENLNTLLGLLSQHIATKKQIEEAANKPNSIDNLFELYQWLPGNLFIGPRHEDNKHTKYVRTDDAGNDFEINAKYIIGDGYLFKKLKDGYDRIKEFNKDEKKQTKENVKNIAACLAQAAKQDKPYPLNADNWIPFGPDHKYKIDILYQRTKAKK